MIIFIIRVLFWNTLPTLTMPKTLTKLTTDKVRDEPYFVINFVDALGIVRVGRVFQKSIRMMDMIIDFTSHETRMSWMCLWLPNHT